MGTDQKNIRHRNRLQVVRDRVAFRTEKLEKLSEKLGGGGTGGYVRAAWSVNYLLRGGELTEKQADALLEKLGKVEMGYWNGMLRGMRAATRKALVTRHIQRHERGA